MMGIKQCREAAGMYQEDLGRILGVTRQTVSMWETGKAWPSANMLPRIARALNCRIEDLYGSEKEAAI